MGLTHPPVDPTKEVDPIQQFRANVVSKIKDDIGDLMPEELMRQIVRDSIEKELYEPVSKQYGYGTQPWIERKIGEFISDEVRAIVSEEIRSKEKEVRKSIKSAVADAIPGMISHLLVELMKGNSYAIQTSIADAMNNRY